MAGRYEVSGKSRFRITATDDDAIASSEGYTTRAGAPGGIGSVKRNADSRFVGLMEQTWNGEVMMGEIATADGKNSLRFSEGIIESIWRPGSYHRRAGPLLVQMTDVQVSAAARHAYDEARSVAAVALLGSSVVDRVVAAAMGRLTFCPHEYFTSRQDAVAWLKRITADPDPRSAGGFDNLPTRQ
jgi:uncharacterized protein YegP (UPF0339 family)